MTEFEKILEQCLLDLELGVSNVDECLSRHPGHALQLRPVLLTHASLERLGEARPSAAFKARVRARLTQQMQAHPRKSSRFNFAFMRLATNFAVILLVLLGAGIAYAQNALPGDTFYAWKLVSENAWRAVSSDPVGTDLAIADRRMNELIAVSNDPVLYSQALEAYLEVASRLKSEMNAENEALILQTLDSQIEELNESGIPVPQFIDEEVLPQVDEILPNLVDPITTLIPVTDTPLVNPTLPASTPSAPEVIPPLLTELPPVVPTDLPEIIPTIQVPPSLPTIKVPTLLP
ncbi:MAG: hypothetical protein L0Z71_11110 [Anaerolineae bacterium]|nr:hypothetical protein [Anaerolineae bacterium]